MPASVTARLIGCMFLCAALSENPSYAQDDQEKAPDCFDALVAARVVKQTPSVISESDDDHIIMRWPWFLDIHIRRVLIGEAPKGRLMVLSVQHTEIRANYGVRRWWLRRNSVAGFNLLGEASGADLVPCPLGSPPAIAYITPGAGETLENLRRRGAREYESRP